jgi:hypothetical protein
MHKTFKLLFLCFSIPLLNSCWGPQPGMGEYLEDNTTSVSNTAGSETRCITLTKPFIVPSGMTSFSLPAGRYIAKQKSKSGYFYYAPSIIPASSSMVPSQKGIYINSQFNAGNLFGTTIYSTRPVRTTVLPGSIFSYIKKSGCY